MSVHCADTSGLRGLAAYASNVSFGHPEHCLDTQKSGFADDDFS